jgi:hypothetical protein
MPSVLASRRADIYRELSVQAMSKWRMQEVVGRTMAVEARITRVFEDGNMETCHDDYCGMG